MQNTMKKVIKFSLLATLVIVGSVFINNSAKALTIADQNGIPSACPSKYPNNTEHCTVFINTITVNGFVDNDISYTARTTPVPYGRLIPGQTITISWTDNTDGWNDPYGTSINNYLVKYGCGNSIDLSNDSYTISAPIGRKYVTWTVPSSVSNYQYCKIWVYAKGIMQNYQPTLGVSNTRAFTIQAPVTKYTCNANYQCVVDTSGAYTSLSTCQANCVAPVRYSCNTSTYQCYQATSGTYATYNDCVTNCQPPFTCLITNFSANPTDINSGGSTYLSWNTSHCNSCTASANPYNASWTGIENTAGGTQPITNLLHTTTFTLNCSGSANSDTKNVTVTVQTPPPIRYNCNTSTYQCYQATNGTYGSYNDCASACQPPITRYTCNSNYQCVVATNGEYSSYSNCLSGCVAPVRYNCNTSTYQCYQATNGTYGSYNDCASACQPPITRYTCNSNYQCVVATNGEYSSYSNCLSGCVAPNQCTITNFTSNDYSITPGNNIVLAWNTSNCNSCSTYANPNNSYWTGSQMIYGSRTIYSLQNSSSFTLTCSNNSTSDTKNLNVNIQSFRPTLSFWADDYTLSQGDSTYLRWASNNANYCVASNGWSGNKSLSSYESTAPNSQTTYTLTCYGNGGQITQSLTLYVTSPTTRLSFTKLGRNLTDGDRVYSKIIRVAQGDVIEFYLTVTAGSANDLSNVVITDNLPSVFSYQSGTTKVNNITQADGIATTGLSLGTIPRNTSKTVTFQALSNNPGTYFTYTNTAQVTASGISVISDSATITFSSVLGAATVQTGAEDSLLISVILSIGLAFLIWYYIKFNPQGKLVFARIESKIRDLHLEYLRKQIKR